MYASQVWQWDLEPTSPVTMLQCPCTPCFPRQRANSRHRWQVAPAELEAVLLQHPDIVDAAVCGTISPNGVDEVPRAYVVRQKKLHETSMITAQEVYQFSRTRLASYKALDGGVCFVEEIPRTPSGKIQRAKLSRMEDYRQSVTAVLLSTGATAEQKGKITEIRDTAMHDAEVAPPRQDTTPYPRRSARLSYHRSNTSTSSCSSEGLSLGSLRMRPRRKITGSTTSSDNGISTTTTSAKKVQKKQAKRSKMGKLVKAVQAAAA